MKISHLLLPLASARFDLGAVKEDHHIQRMQCPPKCVCSKWTCIDEIDLTEIQSMLQAKPISLANDHLVDQTFKCWKSCCKKQGVQVSVCEQNSCQKCCTAECSDVKTIIKTRRKFQQESCNQCLQKKCNHQDEYTSVITSRSCRGLFNKYTTPFNSSVTFQVEANRDLRIFLYDEPLNLIRQSLRKRRGADTINDILDDTEEAERFERTINNLVDEIHQRVRKSVEEQKERARQIKIAEREKIKALRKKKRVKKRKKKNFQKHKYGKNPANRQKPNIPDLTNLVNDLFLNDVQREVAEEEEEYIVYEDESIEELRAQRQENYYYEYEEESEEGVQSEEAPYDCRDHIFPDTDREARKACNQQIKALYRSEKIRLRELSASYRKLKPALDNPLIVSKAVEQTKRQVQLLNNDDIGMSTDEELQAKDDALTRYLTMYGYTDEDGVGDSVFQSVFKNNAQQIFEVHQAEQQRKTIDQPDWTRAHILREMPLATLGSLYVNDQLSKEERKKQLQRANKEVTFARSVRLPPGGGVETTFLEELEGAPVTRRVEEGFADEELGYHGDVLTQGWIQIGIGSSNNTSADLKSCQNSSYKRCIGVLRKSFPDLLKGEDKPQEVTVSVTGDGTERVLSVDIKTKGEDDSRRIFEVLVDDPTIASLKHMAVCTTKGSRSKLGFCCGNQNSINFVKNRLSNIHLDTTPNVSNSYLTNFRRMVDCQFSCLASNCRRECMPETQCEKCLLKNCGDFGGHLL